MVFAQSFPGFRPHHQPADTMRAKARGRKDVQRRICALQYRVLQLLVSLAHVVLTPEEGL